MDTTDPPPLPTLVCDARSPFGADGRVAWRRVTFLDGSGRGDLADWFAAGCWPDAIRAAPKLVLLDAGDRPARCWYADGSRAVALPEVDGVPPPLAWSPEAFDVVGANGSMLARFAASCLPRRRTASLLCSAVRHLRDLGPSAEGDVVLDALAAWASGSREAAEVVREREAFLTAYSALSEHAGTRASRIVDCDEASRPVVAWAAVSAAVWEMEARLGVAVSGLQRSAAEAICRAVPWHELLDAVVACADSSGVAP